MPQASLHTGGRCTIAAKETNEEDRKASFNVPLSKREMCVFDFKTEDQQTRECKCACV